MKYVLFGLAACGVILLAIRHLSNWNSSIIKAEKNIRRIFREVHGDAIIRERIVRGEDGSRILCVQFGEGYPVSDVQINLTSLAIKQETEGLSDEALRWSFHFSE